MSRKGNNQVRTAGQHNRFLTGFTLVEILIVIVLLGILAATVIPRFTGQPDRARTAEAYQMLGALRRAQAAYSDEHNAYVSASIGTGVCDAGCIALGMTSLDAGAIFSYTCDGTSSCTAARTTDGSTIGLNLDNGDWTCGGNYDPAPDPHSGCVPSSRTDVIGSAPE